jgi:hypothetical protein
MQNGDAGGRSRLQDVACIVTCHRTKNQVTTKSHNASTTTINGEQHLQFTALPKA